MKKKFFFSFVITTTLLQITSVHGMYNSEESSEEHQRAMWSETELSFSSEESSKVVSPKEEASYDVSEESSEEFSEGTQEQALLFTMLLKHRSRITHFNIPELMENEIVQLPPLEEFLDGLDFNFGTNGGVAFCKQLYAQEKTVTQVLDLITQTTQKEHERVTQEGMRESSAVLKRSTLEEELLKLVFQNHQEILNEINRQHKENEFGQQSEILCNHAKSSYQNQASSSDK